MCIINREVSAEPTRYLCNGSQGVVVGFDNDNTPIVKFHNGIQTPVEKHIWESEVIPGIGVSGIPLILSWAMTIHKAQGATLDAAEIDVGSGIFDFGQTYVAMSRIRSLKGLFLRGFDPDRIRANPRVVAFYKNFNCI